MRPFLCSCQNTLYFDSTSCISCGHEVGWCPACRNISDVSPLPDAAFSCNTCRAQLVKCHNYAVHSVCNRFLAAPAGPDPLCDCCRFNHTVPNLDLPANREKWARLEAAKRRALYDLTLLRFPFGNQSDNISPPLAFEFKADPHPNQMYRSMQSGQRVFTGHDSGTITINIQEADDAKREKLRVLMHEAQRSLLGHFRHELGHYIWDVLIKSRREPDSIAIFGDHNNPTYSDAMQTYYQSGPRPDWSLSFVSAYASMHPWEDFAETFAVYLDMTSALDTAFHNQLLPELSLDNLETMVPAYQRLGIALNEMNRTNGLLDYLPELFTNPVRAKLQFIHSLRPA